MGMSSQFMHPLQVGSHRSTGLSDYQTIQWLSGWLNSFSSIAQAATKLDKKPLKGRVRQEFIK